MSSTSSKGNTWISRMRTTASAFCNVLHRERRCRDFITHLLLILLIGSVPAWGYSRDRGYYPLGTIGPDSDHPDHHARARQILRRFTVSSPASVRRHPIHPRFTRQ